MAALVFGFVAIALRAWVISLYWAIGPAVVFGWPRFGWPECLAGLMVLGGAVGPRDGPDRGLWEPVGESFILTLMMLAWYPVVAYLVGR
jgi:hypothetical protein